MGVAFFERYSATSEFSKNKKLNPFVVEASLNRTLKIINEFIETLKPTKVIKAEEYGDICIHDSLGFEISFQLVADGLKTFINFSTYYPNKRGKSRKRLYQIKEELAKFLDSK